GTLPFYGLDIWNAYELSWLNMRGKPQIAMMNLTVSSDSPNVVESKSVKLYLNSLVGMRLADTDALMALLRADLSDAFGAPVSLSLIQQPAFASVTIAELEGLLLDRLDIEASRYSLDTSFLMTDTDEPPVEEKLVSHLLKTNCPVTGQPDWASIQIHYAGHAINQEGLLKYLISYREQQEFHEQCIERIFMDILGICKPQALTVYARYTRRGGISINPWRSNTSSGKRPIFIRNARQ
ncbi:MAG: NADPH-dependent 7-cyano-7-deazaguanine reductase QueF, partial [Burkholderiaceae bacterium]|nr:NADPH-dependent 7-cyano-7-deazaguanine reductase QueF [Burkholderiaceae bacterium]